MNAQPIRLYEPATHQERADFEAAWCADCRHWPHEPGPADRECEALLLDPEAWRYNRHGIPVCTRFEPLDGPPALSVAVRDERTADLFGGDPS